MKALIWFPLLITVNILHLTHSQNIFQNIISKEALAEYGMALEAVFGMGLRLRALMNESAPHNFVMSPLSATLIVGQLLLGAEGEFSKQLYDLLSLSGQPQHYNVTYFDKNKKNDSSVLQYANIHLQLSSLLKKLQKRKTEQEFTLNQNSALFYNKNIELKKYFKSNMIRFYDSEIKQLDFGEDTTSILNDWASNHTNGLIKNIVSSPPGPTTSGIFLNSIYFLAEWETPFSDLLNNDDTFFTNENDTVVTTYMMGLIEDIPYVETKDYRLICLPYKNNELGMYILFPNQDSNHKYNMQGFSEKLDPVEVLEKIANAPQRDVIVKIPKLSLSNTLGLLEPLRKYAEYKKTKAQTTNSNNILENLGQHINNYQNFTPEVETDILLTGAANNANFKVSNIIQQMVFSINEKGTEAAAVTAGITDYMGGSKTIILNRPFLFFIRHEATLATLFWGTIMDPSQS